MKMKRTVALILSLVLCLAFAMPAFAATNGWAVENGQSVYYANGAKVSSKWVSNGAMCYYVNSLGYASPAWAISTDSAKLAGLDFIAGAPTANVVYPAAPVVKAPSMNITVDYNTSSQADIARYEDNLFRRHYYGASYAFYDEYNDKAFCNCGEWALVPHNWVQDGKGKKCTNCGHSYIASTYDDEESDEWQD